MEPQFQSRAEHIRTGDVIDWCGRAVTVIAQERVGRPFSRRGNVYLTVESPDVPRRRLHYYADERVIIHA